MTKQMNGNEWVDEARRLFGHDPNDWAFVCPVCGNRQTVGDFRKLQDRTAAPMDAYKMCIGVYIYGARARHEQTGQGPCDCVAADRLYGEVPLVVNGALTFAFAKPLPRSYV